MSDWKRSVYDQENRGSDVHPNMQSRGMFAKNTSSFHDARKSVIAASYVLDQVSGTPTVFHDEMADMAVSVPVSDGDTGILRNPELDEEEVQRDSVGRSLAVKALLGDRDTSDGNFVVAESAGDRKDCYPVDFEFAGTSDSIDVVEKILDLCLVSGEESPYRRPEDIPVFGFSRSEVNGYLREVADEIDADELRRKFGSDDRLDYDSGIKSGNGIASTIYRNITSAQY